MHSYIYTFSNFPNSSIIIKRELDGRSARHISLVFRAAVKLSCLWLSQRKPGNVSEIAAYHLFSVTPRTNYLPLRKTTRGNSLTTRYSHCELGFVMFLSKRRFVLRMRQSQFTAHKKTILTLEKTKVRLQTSESMQIMV